MTVYVDEVRVWPTKIRCFAGGAAHMTADTLDELHAMARRIGLRRAWFQDHPLHPHYDLTPSRRAAALGAGAVFVPARDQARARLAGRGSSRGSGAKLGTGSPGSFERANGFEPSTFSLGSHAPIDPPPPDAGNLGDPRGPDPAPVTDDDPF